MTQIKREVARICRVTDILTSNFVKAEGWTPSYFTTILGNISRINLMGFLVSKDSEGLLFDDGSGSIKIRSFEQNSFNEVEIGDYVLIIGRPRMYAEQKYILPEILKKIDTEWSEFRKAQLELLKGTKTESQSERKTTPVAQVNVPLNPVGNYFQKIIEFIKDLDSGDGADVEEVIKRSNVPNGEELVRRLIEEGEIFEIKPGKLKVLE